MPGHIFLQTGDYDLAAETNVNAAAADKTFVQRTGATGIHFEDHPQLQGYALPEWSHLSAADAKRFTTALVPMVEREFARTEVEPRTVAAH